MHRAFIQSVVFTACLLAFAAPPAALAAQKLPQDSVSRAARCNLRFANCTCDHLIDLETLIADCEKQCQTRYDRCLRWAAQGSKPKPK